MSSARMTVVLTHKGHPCIVTDSQKRMLAFIELRPGALYDDIGEHVGFDRASVTTYMSRLAKAQLIKRGRCKVDGRWRVAVSLRPGVQLHIKVERAWQ